jgi:hypothetical protein
MTHTELMALADDFACYVSNGATVNDQGRRAALSDALLALIENHEGCKSANSMLIDEVAKLEAEAERLREVWLEDSVRATEDRGDLLKERDALLMGLKAASRVCDQDKALMRRTVAAMDKGYMSHHHAEYSECMAQLRARLGGV